MTILNRFIGCFAILASLSWGMDLNDRGTPLPTPPSVVTFEDYAYKLALNDSIDGWGDATGNFGQWYRLTANKNRLADNKGNILKDLSFLCLTPNPIVDGNRLKADYYFPAPNASFDSGPATLSLYHEATGEQLAAASQLTQSSATELTQRILQWQNENYRMAVKSKIIPADDVGVNAPASPRLSTLFERVVKNFPLIWKALGDMTLEPRFSWEHHQENEVWLDLNAEFRDDSTAATNYSPEVLFISKAYTLYVIMIMTTPYILG